MSFISQVRDSCCCCLTFTAHLPSIPPFSKPVKAFFFYLWSLSSPSPFTFASVPSYPSYFQWVDWQKCSFFLGGRMLNMPEWNKKKEGENWKRKDVHEILRATAAALCNVRSVTVIALKCVHVCSCTSVHSHVYISLSVFVSPHMKKCHCITKVDCSPLAVFLFYCSEQENTKLQLISLPFSLPLFYLI